MKNNFTKILFVIFTTISMLGFSGQVKAIDAIDPLVVQFQNNPLFSETDFKPGDIVMRWAKVTNKTTENLIIVAFLDNYSDPDLMGDVFDVIIKDHDSATTIFTGTMTQLAAAVEVVLNPTLIPDVQKQYDFSVAFRPEAGNPYQNKTLSFDIKIKIQGPSQSPTTSPTETPGTFLNLTSGGGGWSSGSGFIQGISTVSPTPSPSDTGGTGTGEVRGESTQRLPQTGLPFGFLLLTYSLAILPFLRKSR